MRQAQLVTADLKDKQRSQEGPRDINNKIRKNQNPWPGETYFQDNAITSWTHAEGHNRATYLDSDQIENVYLLVSINALLDLVRSRRLM